MSKQLSDAIVARAEHFASSYSRFKLASLIGRLNDTKQLENSPLELRQMITYCLDMFKKTNGVFNISIGSELEKLGYGAAYKPGSRLSDELSDDITISGKSIKIAEHIRLDLGGMGKGWLIDSLSEVLEENGHDIFLINGGGDIKAGSAKQRVFIEHPKDADLAIGELWLQHAALASSSLLKRRWADPSGKLFSHIQPAGKKPVAKDLLSIHVKAKNATLADVLATTFLLVEHDERLSLAKLFGASFLEVRSDLTFWQSEAFGFEPYS